MLQLQENVWRRRRVPAATKMPRITKDSRFKRPFSFLSIVMPGFPPTHSRVSGNPKFGSSWVPAFAGTSGETRAASRSRGRFFAPRYVQAGPFDKKGDGAPLGAPCLWCASLARRGASRRSIVGSPGSRRSAGSAPGRACVRKAFALRRPASSSHTGRSARRAGFQGRPVPGSRTSAAGATPRSAS
jgi:hypothetical protein